MKKMILTVMSLVLLIFISCGPSAEDKAKQKAHEDSLVKTRIHVEQSIWVGRHAVFPVEQKRRVCAAGPISSQTVKTVFNAICDIPVVIGQGNGASAIIGNVGARVCFCRRLRDFIKQTYAINVIIRDAVFYPHQHLR